MGLHRLAIAGWLISPKRGFYIIVDPQHRIAGTLPPEWFIHEFMGYLQIPYYVGLLSASQFHGAAHHQPQQFQVVVPRGRNIMRPIQVGNVRIKFFRKRRFSLGVIMKVKTPTGFMNVSSPDTTAWDLIWLNRGAGGIDHIATVFAELAEKLNAILLVAMVKKHGEVVVAQRLGYLLDRVGRPDLTKYLLPLVKEAPLTSLDVSGPKAKTPINQKWHLLINAKIDPET